MGKAKRKQLTRLTACQECRELNLAFRSAVREYRGDIPAHVLYEHRGMRLEGVPG